MIKPLAISAYDHAVVIDTQVVLEAKPLEQLPWPDLFPGSVLLLVCRQVQSEIDAKKNDGRLGRRARAFNKLLDRFIETRTPTQLLPSPRLDVALLANGRIDWDPLDNLDRDDGDDRIVAQVLNAIVDEPAKLVLLSHDMRPRDAAVTHGVRAVKLPEAWLRDPEPSPAARRVAELEGQVRLLSADQPAIAVSLEAVTAEPWTFRTVGEPTQAQVATMLDGLLAKAPRPSSRNPYHFGLSDYDSGHSDRLESWETELRRNMPRMHEGLTRLFAQHRLRVTIENVGPVPAERLSLEIRSGNTVLHSTPYWVLMAGPSAPRPRFHHHYLANLSVGNMLPRTREQFSFYWDEPGPGNHVITSCASFRQGKARSTEISVELLAGSAPRAQIEAVVTASNMKGEAKGQLIVPVAISRCCLDDLYDPARRALVHRPPFDLPVGSDKDDIAWFQNDGTEHQP